MSWQPKQAVVVPIDFSAASKHALATALELVDDPAQVHVIHVLFPLDAMSPGVVWGDVTDDARTAAVRKQFDAFLADAGVSGVTIVTRMGDPGLEIAEYAAEVEADLIVIPSHGYHGVKRLLLGSVAERVIRHAACSVLVLRRDDAV
jgi:nucleotide-binding universal stress UspA family protein